MAKDQEKKLARIYFIKQGKTAKEIAKALSLTEKTVSTWVNGSKPSWKELRNAQLVEQDFLANDFKNLINELVEKRLQLEKDADSDPKDKYKLTLEIKMLRTEYNNIVKKDSITLDKYLGVMDQIFTAMQIEQPELFVKLIDFQEKHINEAAIKLS